MGIMKSAFWKKIDVIDGHKREELSVGLHRQDSITIGVIYN